MPNPLPISYPNARLCIQSKPVKTPYFQSQNPKFPYTIYRCVLGTSPLIPSTTDLQFLCGGALCGSLMTLLNLLKIPFGLSFPFLRCGGETELGGLSVAPLVPLCLLLFPLAGSSTGMVRYFLNSSGSESLEPCASNMSRRDMRLSSNGHVPEYEVRKCPGPISRELVEVWPHVDGRVLDSERIREAWKRCFGALRLVGEICFVGELFLSLSRRPMIAI